jgi:hypothetical protein
MGVKSLIGNWLNEAGIQLRTRMANGGWRIEKTGIEGRRVKGYGLDDCRKKSRNESSTRD